MKTKFATCIREIRKVGLRDWIWFVLHLKRDEYSRKLDLSNYSDMRKLIRDRDRSHKLDTILNPPKMRQPHE